MRWGKLTSCFSEKENIVGRSFGGPTGGVGERSRSSSLISDDAMTGSREVLQCSEFGTFFETKFFRVFDRNFLSGEAPGGGSGQLRHSIGVHGAAGHDAGGAVVREERIVDIVAASRWTRECRHSNFCLSAIFSRCVVL